jgi:hypothetical protein
VRRWLITIVIFLLAGAVVNVAVAWACAVWIDIVLILDQRSDTAGFTWGSHDGLDYFRWEHWAGARFFVFRGFQRASNSSEVPFDGWHPPWASHFLDGMTTESPEGPRAYRRRIAEARGWPHLALHGGYGVDLNPEGTVYPWFALMLDQPPARTPNPLSSAEARFLPLRPISPGFAVNTIFYAAILWLLILGPFVLRRFLRAKRHLCPWCAYPVGESVACTECGKPLPKRAVA